MSLGSPGKTYEDARDIHSVDQFRVVLANASRMIEVVVRFKPVGDSFEILVQ